MKNISLRRKIFPNRKAGKDAAISSEEKPLWNLGIAELEGRIIEARGREEVNEMLRNGWMLLHIYTLTYKEEDGVWRERPMVILGKPKRNQKG